MTFLTWNLFKYMDGIQEIFVKVLVLKMVIWVRRAFLEKIMIWIEYLQLVLLEFCFLHSIQCVYAIFWWFSTEKMRICLWSYKFFYCFDATHRMRSIGYACFSLRKMHLESRMYAGETWNSLEYDDTWLRLFSSRRMLFCPWGPEMVQKRYETIRNVMHLWNSLKYDASMK